jgi:threonine dehydrogenase-like Zn-dependent dehydrogenase
MLATMLYAPGDVRCEDVEEPKILKPTDAIIQLSASCVCGSDLWPFRGANEVTTPMAMGHEYCGIVVAVGSAVKTVRPGQFVVGSFCLSDNTCPHCRFGFQSSCEQREFMTGAQAPFARVPLADGTLVATAELPSDDSSRACSPPRTFSAPAGTPPMLQVSGKARPWLSSVTAPSA